MIEIFASVVVIWELTGTQVQREKLALQLIGSAFFALALYIPVQATYALVTASHPQKSLLGIAWLASTVVVMLLLAWGKHMTGRSLGNPVLSKEAHVTLIDAVLAGAVLAGLTLKRDGEAVVG